MAHGKRASILGQMQKQYNAKRPQMTNRQAIEFELKASEGLASALEELNRPLYSQYAEEYRRGDYNMFLYRRAS